MIAQLNDVIWSAIYTVRKNAIRIISVRKSIKLQVIYPQLKTPLLLVGQNKSYPLNILQNLGINALLHGGSHPADLQNSEGEFGWFASLCL
jgi:hypothetical protein